MPSGRVGYQSLALHHAEQLLRKKGNVTHFNFNFANLLQFLVELTIPADLYCLIQLHHLMLMKLKQLIEPRELVAHPAQGHY